MIGSSFQCFLPWDKEREEESFHKVHMGTLSYSYYILFYRTFKEYVKISKNPWYLYFYLAKFIDLICVTSRFIYLFS